MLSIFSSRAQSWGNTGCDGRTAIDPNSEMGRQSGGVKKTLTWIRTPGLESRLEYGALGKLLQPLGLNFVFSLEIRRSILLGLCDEEMRSCVPKHCVSCKIMCTTTSAKPWGASFPKGRTLRVRYLCFSLYSALEQVFNPFSALVLPPL